MEGGMNIKALLLAVCFLSFSVASTPMVWEITKDHTTSPHDTWPTAAVQSVCVDTSSTLGVGLVSVFPPAGAPGPIDVPYSLRNITSLHPSLGVGSELLPGLFSDSLHQAFVAPRTAPPVAHAHSPATVPLGRAHEANTHAAVRESVIGGSWVVSAGAKGSFDSLWVLSAPGSHLEVLPGLLKSQVVTELLSLLPVVQSDIQGISVCLTSTAVTLRVELDAATTGDVAEGWSVEDSDSPVRVCGPDTEQELSDCHLTLCADSGVQGMVRTTGVCEALPVVSGISRELTKTGFHRGLVSEVSLSEPLSPECSLTLVELVQPAWYLEEDELRVQHEFGLVPSYVVPSPIDFEKPAFLSTSHFPAFSLPAPTASDPRRVTVEIPVHLRYHAPTPGGGYVDIGLSPPVVVLECGGGVMSGVKVSTPPVTLYAPFPVGDTDLRPLIARWTSIVAVAGCVLASFRMFW